MSALSAYMKQLKNRWSDFHEELSYHFNVHSDLQILTTTLHKTYVFLCVTEAKLTAHLSRQNALNKCFIFNTPFLSHTVSEIINKWNTMHIFLNSCTQQSS